MKEYMEPIEAWELSILALCVWREARGEPSNAKIGVAWTVVNRARKPGWWGGPDLTSVITHPLQYSSFNHNDPNATKFPQTTDESFKECLDAADGAHSSLYLDPTKGATHYYDSSLDTDPPYWAKGKTPLVTLGRLRFFRVE